MQSQSKITISLPPELEAFVKAKVESGKYVNADALIQASLRTFLQKHNEREEQLKIVREKIEIGWQEAERGEVRDGKEVMRDILEKLERRIAESKAAG